MRKFLFINSVILLLTFLNVGKLAAGGAGKSMSYDEAIAFYQHLDNTYKTAKLFTEGLTDVGRPLHLFVISADEKFSASEAKKAGKLVILINNGIHPGEPDGIDASAKLAEELLNGKRTLPANVVICIIPVYNIDGALNRGCCSRANQDGPELYGFRGNARNLDLNRDMIKCDSENARSFTKIFRNWDPDVFIDTHVSDGADYQYTLTLISTQHNKLGGPAGDFLKKEMTPSLFDLMKKRGNEMAPYVNTEKYDESPDKGIFGFMELPRFASGYAALFSCLAFVSETHMLKPFDKRVEATLVFLEEVVAYASINSGKIMDVRKKSRELIRTQPEFALNWELDSARSELISFHGYEAEYRKSTVTGLDQLYYNRAKPYTKEVKFYDEYMPSILVKKPAYYVVPQAWREVIERMQLNGVVMTRLEEDVTLQVETYVIEDFKTGNTPYEGHYVHNSTSLKKEIRNVTYHKGDYKIMVNQDCNRYIVETLEPAGPDSWFSWGFFDSILQQKEWFSAYVFDPVAAKILVENEPLRNEFEKKKSSDPEFAANSFSQLYFIYKKSKYFEDFRRYPVGRGIN